MCAENNALVGLALRFLLSFGSAGELGDNRLTEYSLCLCFTVHGENFRRDGESSWFIEAFLIRTSHLFVDGDRQTAFFFFLNLRRRAALLPGHPTCGTLLRSATNKAVHWIGSVALQSMLLATIIPLLSDEAGLLRDADHVFQTKILTRDALVAETRLIWCRNAFGIAVLQGDVSEKTWQTIDLPLDG